MKPTSKLRFIERTIEEHGDPKPVRILQQWWQEDQWDHYIRLAKTGNPAIEGEWRDVPLEAE